MILNSFLHIMSYQQVLYLLLLLHLLHHMMFHFHLLLYSILQRYNFLQLMLVQLM